MANFAFLHFVSYKVAMIFYFFHRSVPDNQRSFAMGLQFLILRSCAMLPGPIFVGKILDTTCLIWKTNECGRKENCYEYDLDKLSMRIAASSSISAGNIIYYHIFIKIKIPCFY